MKKIFVIVCLFLMCTTIAQQTDYIDFKSAEVELKLSSKNKSVSGKVLYKFKVLKDIDSVYLNALNYKQVNAVIDLDSNGANIESNKKYIVVKKKLKANTVHELLVTWLTYPKKAMYFLKKGKANQIWTQGQGKYTSNWLPSIDDVNDKIEFNLKITYNKAYKVIANGKLKNKQINDSTITWHYDMQKPMSSYLVALAIGKYTKKTETSKRGIPLEMYYYPKDSLKVKPTYRYTKRIFDYLENEIGFPYPWQNYKQAPVHDFLYAGMENTSFTIFSDAFVVDDIGYNDKNYNTVNAHELAHQWFGNLVTATSGEHHWLQEGFATYYALLSERDIFGDNHYYYKLYESLIDLSKQELSGKGTSLLNPKSSSLTFYQHGAWVLHALRHKVGDVIFKQSVKNYLSKHQFSNVNTSDFILEVERLYGKSLATFVNLWIKQKAFPYEKAFELLQQHSFFINEYVKVDCEVNTSKCKDYLRYYASDEAKTKVISQMPNLVTKDAFKSSLKVRQAISKYVTKIPKDLKPDYETLLDDKSYITIEKALYNLWVNFPLERSKYLSKTRNIVGFKDKNVRLLWIVLNLNTPYYQADSKQGLYNELLSYTGKAYNADLRIKAFQYLDMIKACNEACKANLEIAKSHHNWRLVKFAKQFSEQLKNNK